MFGSMTRFESRKAQSAMKYLMTYGWLILILAVVIAVLFDVGVFTPPLQSSCLSISGYLCSTPRIDSSGALTIQFSRTTGSPITITGLECSKGGSPDGVMYSVGGIGTIQSGASTNLTFACPLPSSNIGTLFAGTLWIQYSQNSHSGLIGEVGKVTGSIQSSGERAGVWIVDSGTNNVTELYSTGTLIGTYSAGGAYSYPDVLADAIAIDANGNVWVADGNTNNVTELSSTGTLIGTYSTGANSGPDAIAILGNSGA